MGARFSGLFRIPPGDLFPGAEGGLHFNFQKKSYSPINRCIPSQRNRAAKTQRTIPNPRLIQT